MIVVTHRPGPGGWEFDSDVGLDGATRTLAASVECSEHAARHYLSRRQGYEVLQDDARHQVEHVVLSDGSSAPAPPANPGSGLERRTHDVARRSPRCTRVY
jgi:hypothetical protein